MSLNKVVIWDDEEEVARGWGETIQTLIPAVDVVWSRPADVRDEIQELIKRRDAFVKKDDTGSGEHALDSADVLIVDNDLFELEDLSGLTAETVASLARLYTNCKFIIVVNLATDIDFDLSLKGRPESEADLHINDKFIANPGLWTACPHPDGGFRPWHWPLLVDANDRFDARVNDIQELLASSADTPILEFFGFNEDARNRLSRTARGFLHPKEKEVDRVTFTEFVTQNTNGVSSKRERAALDRTGDKNKIARVAASRLHKWLERLVVGPQDILVDLPHLVQRFPFLLPEAGREDVNFWNETVNLQEICGLNDPGLIEFARFAATNWVSRPLFWWSHLESNEKLMNQMIQEKDSNPAQFVFCEDVSSFLPRDQAKPFVAAFHSSFDRRFVSRV